MLGGSVSFFCGADGDPTPNIEWRKVGGESLPSDRTTVSRGNLTISDLILRDAGKPIQL